MQNHAQISYINIRCVLTAVRVAAVSEPLTHPIWLRHSWQLVSVGTILVICQFLKLDFLPLLPTNLNDFVCYFRALNVLKFILLIRAYFLNTLVSLWADNILTPALLDVCKFLCCIVCEIVYNLPWLYWHLWW